MVDYLLIALIIFILILDNPINNNKDELGLIYKLLKYLILILGIIHLIDLWNMQHEIDKGLVSGVLLIGLTFIYTLATEHTGIEDKVARKLFKILSWTLLWIILGVHFYIIYKLT